MPPHRGGIFRLVLRTSFSFHASALQCVIMNRVLSYITIATISFCSFSGMIHAADEPVFDLGIESMRSQEYSIGIFIFMIVSMLVFVGVIALFYKKTDMSSVKTGEKVLMGMIVLGVIVSAIFAAVQMLDGFLI